MALKQLMAAGYSYLCFYVKENLEINKCKHLNVYIRTKIAARAIHMQSD